MTNGHASDEELDRVSRLEATLDPATSPVDDLLELGLLYLEPLHREDDAIAILEAILGQEPDYAPAKLWLAHTLLHHVMDDAALARSRELLESMLESGGDLSAAARMLLAEVLEEQGATRLQDRIALLEESVAQEPRWVYNRQSLAWAYDEAGRQRDAFDQIDDAVRNATGVHPEASVALRAFEESITGRGGHRAKERLLEDRDRIERELEGGDRR
jgi:tetratricopeptide (TPR) repeat protein